MENNTETSRIFSSKELYGLYQFANAQLQIIKTQTETAHNNVEVRCLAFAGNCIVDIMDEIAEMLEPSEKIVE